jgi:hypothetical protein
VSSIRRHWGGLVADNRSFLSPITVNLR